MPWCAPSPSIGSPRRRRWRKSSAFSSPAANSARWNMRDARVGWVRKLNQIVDSHEGDAPRFYTGEWRKFFPFKGFEPLQEQVFMLATAAR